VPTNLAMIVPLAVFLSVNVPPWFGFSYLVTVLQWATFQNSPPLGGNLVFPITYASALSTLVGVAYLFRKRIGLSWISSLVLGAGLATAGAGLFELLWQGVGYVFYPREITGGIWLANYVLNGSWILLSVGSIQYWKISKKFLVTGIAFVAGWVLWITLGFPQVFQASAGLLALVMNSSLKILSFLLFSSLVIFNRGARESEDLAVAVDH
jgi:hypothetical protein